MRPWQQGLVLMSRFLGRGRARAAAILLAVAWGTLSMMMLLAFGEGLKQQMIVGGSGLGEAGAVILWAGTTTRPWQGMKPGRDVRFTKEDVDALRRGIPELDEVAGERVSYSTSLRCGATTISARLTGVLPCYERIRAHHARRGGRFINDVDQERGRRVIFLGSEIQKRLMGSAEAVGQDVFVNGVPFTVIGVMIDKQQMGMYGGPDANKASIPLSAFEDLFGEHPYANILYTVRPPHTTHEVEPRVREVFSRRQQFDPQDESAVYFWDTASNREEMEKIMRGLQIFLGIVGAMTLMVAGVGLANMLFVLVHRRTREIGLQMAVGAQRAVITARVVGEALVLAGLGGYLGIGLSWLLVEVLQRIPIRSEGLQFLGKPTLSIPLGVVTVLVLVGIGCMSGILPARRASRLNPVEALRHE